VKTIFLISGKAESGKDTVSNLLMKHLKCGDMWTMHIADNVKRVARNTFGWDNKKDERGRQLLQMIGDGGRQYNPDIWIEYFLYDLDNMISGNMEYGYQDFAVTIPDVRYKNEVLKLLDYCHKRDYNCVTIRVERPNHENKLTEEQRKNSSETELDDWGIWDYKIINDSDLKALERVVLNLLEVGHYEYKS
jgi:hypothetical protein